MPKKIDVPYDVVIGLYRELQSIDKVAARVGVSRTTVKRRLRTAGVLLLGPKVIDKDRREKRCHQCKRVKAIDNFHYCRSRADGRGATCRACWAQYRSAWWLKNRFGITQAQYDEILSRQGGGCAICGVTGGMVRCGKVLRLAVDHCHETGQVRGILCNSCNPGLGNFKDNPVLLRRAAAYLELEG